MQHIKRLRFLGLCLMCAALSQAQSDYTHVVKFNPIGILANQYQLAYEHALNDHFSVQLSAGIMTGTAELSATDSTGTIQGSLVASKRSGFIVIPEARWYPKGTACKGVYLALAGRFRSVSNTNEESGDVLLKRTANGGALLFGYQSQSDIAWEFFIGPQIKIVNEESDYDDDNSSGLFGESDGVGLRFGVNFGVGW
tara:strand:- start:142 stop:732 length:591 start_codon:yes stop_codon:yes gene_type:complete